MEDAQAPEKSRARQTAFRADTGEAKLQPSLPTSAGGLGSASEPRTLLESVFRAAPIGIGLVCGRVFTEVNDRLCTMTGYRADELIGQSARILYPTQEDYEYVGKEKYDQITRLGTGAVETRWKRKDGTVLDILLSSTPLDSADWSKGVAFTALDITEHKLALRERENVARFPSENPYPVLRIAWDGRVLYANPAGVPLLADRGTRIGSRAPADWAALVAQVLDSGAIGQLEVEHQSRTLILHAVPVPTAQYVNFYGSDVTGRKKAEDELQSVFELSLDMICIIDINTPRFLKVNPAFERALGYTQADLESRPFLDLIHPDDVEQTRAAIEEKLRQGQVVINLENRYRCKDGSYRWLNWTSRPKLEQGTAYAIARDVTERKRADEILREREAILNETGMIARIGGWKHDLVTGQATWTQALYDIIEIESGPPPGVNEHLSYYPPEPRRVLEEAYRRAVEKGEPFDLELEVVTAKGRPMWCRVIGRPTMRKGVCVEMRGTFQDITAQKHAEVELRRQRDRTQMYLDVAGVMFVVLDRNGRVSLINKKGCEILGYDEHEILGVPWIATFFPESLGQEACDRFDQIMRGQIAMTESAETPVLIRDGSERIIAWHSTVLTDETGAIVGSLSSGEDITERKQAEQRLREQRENEKQRIETELAKVQDQLVRKTRLAAIGQMSASIAHDLRNPLGAVRNAAYLLKRRMPQGEPRLSDPIEIIEQEVNKADRIITNLLNMTRARSANKEEVDIGRLVRDVFAHTTKAGEVGCRVSLSVEPFIIEADVNQISQVLANVFDNAVEAMQGCGELSLEATRHPDGDILVFRDTGPGWPEAVRERAFEPLVTTKTTGTGLGLAICRQIVESHGGTIEAADNEPQGAVIRIMLPRRNEATT